MNTVSSPELFAFWQNTHRAPYHFPMDAPIWEESMYRDHDSDGRLLFAELNTEILESDGIRGMIQYGKTAFGFDDAGEISGNVHYPVIRTLCFDPQCPQDGQILLDAAKEYFQNEPRIYAYFHYFGMSACGRHGKLHEKDRHIEQLLLENGFTIEHENVYYAKELTGEEASPEAVHLQWRELSSGGCREFAASVDGKEVCWGQVHFLPQADTAYLRWIYTDGSQQHRGIGSAVMQCLFAQLYRMGIRRFDTDTALDNTIAQSYYEKNGFIHQGITRSYFTAK